jgi:hypothetical protein
MKLRLRFALPSTLLLASLAFAQSPIPSGEFKRIQLTDEFWAEGANFGDFNKDGKNDVVYGQFWWEGPDFAKKHEYFKVEKSFTVKAADGTEKTVQGYKGALSTENDYSKNFLAYTHDFNADGWTDILILGFPGEQSWWFENPQGKEGLWKQHVALDVTDNESPTFTDLTGDGKPEIVCMSKGKIGYATPDAKNPTAPFAWHPISPAVTTKNKDGKDVNVFQRFTHGLGIGDVNGDGKMDVLEKDGWWQQPASLDGDPAWTKNEAKFGDGGAQMFAYDVNSDGRNDIITSLQAHGYGLVWFEQTNDGGVVGWTKHMIVGDKPEQNPQGIVFSQPHAIDLVDMNGDGAKDIVTGKRFWAHGPKGDNDPNGTPVLYWFELDRTANKLRFVGHLIDDASGIGTQVVAGDINGDKKPDVVVGNKRGAFVLLRK